MLVYWKNAFVLRWIVTDSPIMMLRDMAAANLGEEWLRPGLYVFNHVEKAVEAHCR